MEWIKPFYCEDIERDCQECQHFISKEELERCRLLRVIKCRALLRQPAYKAIDSIDIKGCAGLTESKSL